MTGKKRVDKQIIMNECGKQKKKKEKDRTKHMRRK